MRNQLLIVVGVLLAAGTAMAEPSKAQGGYIGAGFGRTLFDDGGAFASFSQDDTDTGFMFFGGYKFLKYFSVEGRYTDFGTFTVDGLRLDASALSAHAIGIIPFGDSSWEMFGQLGLGTLDVEIPGASSDSEAVLSGGLGVRFSPTKNFSFSAQTDVYVYEDTSLGYSYDVGFGGTSITARYIF